MRAAPVGRTEMKIRLDIKDHKTLETLKRSIYAEKEFFSAVPESAPKFDLAIIELGPRPLDIEFDAIRRVKETGGAKEIFLVSLKAEPETLIKALRAGISEFLPIPLSEAEARDALRRFRSRTERAGSAEGQRNGKIITVLGSKGGVGATTVAVNIAAGISSRDGGSLVSILDLKLPFGDVAVFMNINSVFNLADVTKNIERLDSTYLMSAFTRHSSGVYVLPASSLPEGLERAERMVFERLLSAIRGLFDFIIIDAGMALDEGVLEALRTSDTVFIVVDQSIPSMVNLKKFMQVFRELGYPGEKDLRIIVNRYRKNSAITKVEAEKSIGGKIFSFIPNDYASSSAALDQGSPLVSAAPKAPVSEGLLGLAASVSGGNGNGSQDKNRGGIFGFFSKKEEKGP